MLDPDATPQDPGCFPFHAKFRTRASREDTEVQGGGLVIGGLVIALVILLTTGGVI